VEYGGVNAPRLLSVSLSATPRAEICISNADRY